MQRTAERRAPPSTRPSRPRPSPRPRATTGGEGGAAARDDEYPCDRAAGDEVGHLLRVRLRVRLSVRLRLWLGRRLRLRVVSRGRSRSPVAPPPRMRRGPRPASRRATRPRTTHWIKAKPSPRPRRRWGRSSSRRPPRRNTRTTRAELEPQPLRDARGAPLRACLTLQTAPPAASVPLVRGALGRGVISTGGAAPPRHCTASSSGGAERILNGCHWISLLPLTDGGPG